MKKYSELENAIEVMGFCTKVSLDELKLRYRELSKLYHPDMPTADEKKFQEVHRAYKFLKEYMEGFRFSFSKEEFESQFPSILSQEDWLSGRTR